MIVFTAGTAVPHSGDPHHWTDEEIDVLKSLWLGSLPEKPKIHSNKYADDPKAAKLGREFFFDKQFSGNSNVSCGTCHRPDYSFTDDLPLAHGMGFTGRRAMPLAGSAYFTWLFWDGRKDSLWSQALGPIESPVEHGISRTFVIKVILEHYRAKYQSVFGTLPEIKGIKKLIARPAMDDPDAYKAWVTIPFEDREKINNIYANFGKAIEAYVRTIMPGPSRFDEYVQSLLEGRQDQLMKIYTKEEAEGLHLFIGEANCTNCHAGPLFTNSDFHNLGITGDGGSSDPGRAGGIISVLSDEFNCLGKYSDAKSRYCRELRFIDTKSGKYFGAFKTPSLRNVVDRPPYMHAGQLKTIKDVLDFYRKSKNPELEHGGLSAGDMEKVEAFLKTLSGPIEALGE